MSLDFAFDLIALDVCCTLAKKNDFVVFRGIYRIIGVQQWFKSGPKLSVIAIFGRKPSYSFISLIATSNNGSQGR